MAFLARIGEMSYFLMIKIYEITKMTINKHWPQQTNAHTSKQQLITFKIKQTNKQKTYTV